MRASIVALMLLCAAPCLAAEGRDDDGDGWRDPASALAATADGIYRGQGTFAGGNSQTCRGMQYMLEVKGGAVSGMAAAAPGASGIGGAVSGVLQPDGSVAMSYVVPGNSGRVEIALTLADGTFSGYSQSQTCRYNITATRN